MEEHDGRSVALVEVGQPQPFDRAVVRLEGEVRKAVEQLVRRADRVHAADYFSPSRFNAGSSAAASFEAVMWITVGSRTHAIRLSACRRLRKNWKA